MSQLKKSNTVKKKTCKMNETIAKNYSCPNRTRTSTGLLVNEVYLTFSFPEGQDTPSI